MRTLSHLENHLLKSAEKLDPQERAAVDKVVAEKPEFIVVQDSDDISYPNRLQITHEYFETVPETEVFYGNIVINKKETQEKRTRWFQPFNKELLKQVDYIPHPASAYKKSAYDSVKGYDSELKIGSDYDLFLQFLDANKKFGFVDQILTEYRIHSGNISVGKVGTLKEYEHKIKEKHGLPKEIDKTLIKKLAHPEVSEAFKNKT